MRPEAADSEPKQFVEWTQPWLRMLAFQDDQLLAKDEVFQHQAALRTKNAKHGSEAEPKQVKHGSKFIADRFAGSPAKLLISKPDRIVTRDRSCFDQQILTLSLPRNNRQDVNNRGIFGRRPSRAVARKGDESVMRFVEEPRSLRPGRASWIHRDIGPQF